jgi:hypothetical protein
MRTPLQITFLAQLGNGAMLYGLQYPGLYGCCLKRLRRGQQTRMIEGRPARDETKSDTIQFGSFAVPFKQFATQGNAILGIRDSGKSYTATFFGRKAPGLRHPFCCI